MQTRGLSVGYGDTPRYKPVKRAEVIHRRMAHAGRPPRAHTVTSGGPLVLEDLRTVGHDRRARRPIPVKIVRATRLEPAAGYRVRWCNRKAAATMPLVAVTRDSLLACREVRLMALTYEEARRRAEVSVDAFNRRDPDPIVATLHEAVTIRGTFVADHVGHERSHLEGRETHGDFLRWLWEKEPPLRHVLEEVFVGSDGYAFLTRSEHDGTRYVFVKQLDADGLVRHLHVYHRSPPAS